VDFYEWWQIVSELKVEFEGLDKVLEKLSYSRQLEKSLEGAVFQGAKLVQGQARNLIKTRTVGRQYRVYNEGVRRLSTPINQTAGAKGSAPNTLFGYLMKNIQATSKGLTAHVVSRMNYSRRQEYGGHPFLRPAIKMQAKAIKTVIQIAIRTHLGR